MAGVVLEIMHPPKGQKEYKSFQGDSVRIGRGYNNDVIIADPYVGAVHLVLVPEGDGWWAEDLGSQNGIFSIKQKKVFKRIFLESGDEFIIGKTQIRILSPDYPVPQEKRLIQKSKFIKYMNNPLVKWLTILGLLGLYALEAHMVSEKSLSVGKLMSSGVGMLVLTLVWAGLFAFIGGIVKHKARFFLQLAVSCLFMILLLPAGNFASYIGYATSQGAIEMGLYVIVVCVLFAYFLVRNLAISTNIAVRRLIIASTVITAFILFTLILLLYAFKDEFNPKADYYATLKPPFARVLPAKSLDQYFIDAEEIFFFKHGR